MLIPGLVLSVFSRICTSTPSSHVHATHYHVLHALSLSGFTSYSPFSLFHTPTHTHSHSQLFAFPFFLQRDLWWGECWRQAITMSCLNSSVRQSGRGGSGDIRRPFPATRPPLTCLPPPPALAHVNPAAVAARSPTRPSFHQYCGAAPFSLCLPAIRLDVKCRELNVHSTNQSNFRSTGSVHCYKCTGIGLWYWDVLTFYLLT